MLLWSLVTRIDGSSGGRGFTSVCLSVCLSVRTISKTAPPSITHFNIEMFYHESWKPIYFWVKRSKVKVSRYKETLLAWVFALLWVLASCSLLSCEVCGVMQTKRGDCDSFHCAWKPVYCQVKIPRHVGIRWPAGHQGFISNRTGAPLFWPRSAH